MSILMIGIANRSVIGNARAADARLLVWYVHTIPTRHADGQTGTCVYEVDEVRDMNDPTVAETDRLRKRIAELEQVVRELRQKNPARASNAPPALSSSAIAQSSPALGVEMENEKLQDNKKRRVIVDRFARFKIDEAAMAAVASAAAASGEGPPANTDLPGVNNPNLPVVSVSMDDAGSGKRDYKTEPYATYLLPGEEMVYDRIGRKTFLGAAAGKSMLRRVSWRLCDTDASFANLRQIRPKDSPLQMRIC